MNKYLKTVVIIVIILIVSAISFITLGELKNILSNQFGKKIGNISQVLFVPIFLTYYLLYNKYIKPKYSKSLKTTNKNIVIGFVISAFFIAINFSIYLILFNYLKFDYIFQQPTFAVSPIILLFSFALVEEVLFRYLIYNAITNSFNRNFSILTTAIIFSIFHLDAYVGGSEIYISFLNAFFISIILSLIIERYSIWSAIILHFMYNYYLTMTYENNSKGWLLIEKLSFKIFESYPDYSTLITIIIVLVVFYYFDKNK